MSASFLPFKLKSFKEHSDFNRSWNSNKFYKNKPYTYKFGILTKLNINGSKLSFESYRHALSLNTQDFVQPVSL